MNIKNKLILIIGAVLFIQSCYTVIDRQQRINGKYMSEEHEFNDLNIKLIGVWINVETWTDYGDRFRRLEFYENGFLKYNPASEILNSETYFGSWRTYNDSLSIKFDHYSKKELMKFYILENNLIIPRIIITKRLASEESFSRRISDYSKDIIWSKEIF